MKKNILLLNAVLIIFVFSVQGQMADKAELESMKKDYLGFKPAEKPFALLDLSRLQWSNSYSFSFASGGGNSASLGIYTASLLYEFSPKLIMHLDLGLAHDPGVLVDRTANSDLDILTNLRLDYRPSRNFFLSVGINTYPGSGLYRPYYWPYSNHYIRED